MTIARGARHGRAKLTARQVRAIRAARQRPQPLSYRALALRYGVSAQQILRIVHGQHWT